MFRLENMFDKNRKPHRTHINLSEIFGEKFIITVFYPDHDDKIRERARERVSHRIGHFHDECLSNSSTQRPNFAVTLLCDLYDFAYRGGGKKHGSSLNNMQWEASKKVYEKIIGSVSGQYKNNLKRVAKNLDFIQPTQGENNEQ